MMKALLFTGPIPVRSLSVSKFKGKAISSRIRSDDVERKGGYRAPYSKRIITCQQQLDYESNDKTNMAQQLSRELRASDSIPAGRNKKMKVHIHGLVAKKTEKVVEMKNGDASSEGKRMFSSFRPKAYWESMGIIPWFALFGVVILAIKMLRVALGIKEREQSEGARRSMAASTTEEEKKELHEYKCGGCGYVMYPARGREFKFFPDSFRCPLCQAPKSEFWDLRDPNDPRNQEESEDEEGEEETVEEGDVVGSGDTVDDEQDQSRSTESVEGNGDADLSIQGVGKETEEAADVPRAKNDRQ